MIKTFTDHPLRDLNSFHVEERADQIIEFDQREDLDKIFAEAHAPAKWYVLGGGNNILFTSRYEGTLLHPVGQQIRIIGEEAESVLIEAEAGVDWDCFVEWCVERELWGAENLSLIPGTVGAAPVQNIGAYGAEAKDIIHRVHYFDTERREHLTLHCNDCHFAYRDSIFKGELRSRAIITSVEFSLNRTPKPNLGYGDLKREVEARGGSTLRNIRDAVCAIRRSKLPDTAVLGNAGSFFKNPIVKEAVAERLKSEYEDMPLYPTADPTKRKLAAGWLIDQSGLKGYRTGNVGVHDRQALVLVNHGGATGEEVMALARYVQQTVAAKFGIDIEAEVNVL
ncbi:MAG: UDP-N-acetylmuramate dehydrogenase [Alistipes sp.]|jgi:UDP-N-acetylmuramate dehydrogenase|nr:UDP-N-acetylmuramate dehydrogenase [Alistipes sp.]